MAITQPRRVAATSIAKRVAQEMKVELGTLVGYSVRFDDCYSPSRTKIKYMTDGMLLRELVANPSLSSYSHIILDEAHERSVRTDILFGVLKLLLEGHRARNLKVIVMSATMNAAKFSEFFGAAPVLNIPGRLHPVRMFYSVEPQLDYIDSTIQTIVQLHCEKGMKGDFLAFLSGQEEIEAVKSVLLDISSHCPVDALKMLVCPLYASLPSHQQAAVFNKAPLGYRKIILATNIAETSLTIPGVRVVIDSGVAKMRYFDAMLGIETLSVQPVSQSAAKQRAGRAGREAPGSCYRLFTEACFNEMLSDVIPEIHRVSLSSSLLTMKASNVDIFTFPFIDRPSKVALCRALEELYIIGALEKDGSLSSVGMKMASFPLIPSLSRVILAAIDSSCIEAVATIIAFLSVDNVYVNSKQNEASMSRRLLFCDKSGDHITALNVFKAYAEQQDKQTWCKDHSINHRSMKQVVDVRNQLLQLSIKYPSSCSTSTADSEIERILKCFLKGCSLQVAIKQQADSSYKIISTNQNVFIHPSSLLFGKKPECILYNEVVFTTKCYVKGVSEIDPIWVNKNLKK